MVRLKGEPTRYPGIDKVPSPRFERGYGYRARADAREAGKGQPEQTFPTVAEARQWQTDTKAKAASGTLVKKSTLTVRQAIEAWLGGERGEKNTHDARRLAVKPIVTAYGDRKAQSITKADAEKLLRQLVAGEAKGSRKRGVGYTNVMRAKWASCWDDLVKQGHLPRNVIALVKPLQAPTTQGDGDAEDEVAGGALDPHRRLTDAEIAALVTAHAPREPETPLKGAAIRSERVRLRRGVFIELALLGLRRGELAGLRWDAVSGLDGPTPTLHVARTRVATHGAIEEKRKGKTREALRSIPLPPEAVAALQRHRAMRDDDKARAGKGWQGGPNPAVLAVDAGSPLSPRTLDSWWKDSLALAGVRDYRLHDCRHTAASRLLSAHVPLLQVASWLGHADGGVLALRVYGHANPEELRVAAAALSRTKPA